MTDSTQADVIKNRFWDRLQSHHKAALAIAVIVALADTVIVYDLWLAGSWLTNPLLSAFKTAAFIILFIGALIAEMQDLQKGTRLLLFGGVLILGTYQAGVNVVANYHGATIPQSAVEFFSPLANPMQVKFWYSLVDGIVRTTVVIIMWLVTGLVWRGLATGDSASSAELAETQEQLGIVKDRFVKLQSDYNHVQAERDHLQSVAQSVQFFDSLEPEMKARVLAQCRNGDGPTNQQIAEWLDVSPSTVGRWIKKES